MKRVTMIDCFSIIQDPRLDRTRKHELIDILVLAVCGVICGCDNWVEIAQFGESKKAWFKSFLRLSNGIPSHDTFARVFSLIDSSALQKGFYSWVRENFDVQNDVIAIDGKYIKSSHGSTTKKKRSIFGMVNAWSTKAGVALAQLRTDFDKKNEKTVFSNLIEILYLEGSIVTLDANGCHARIANEILDKKGDYFFALKNNQKSLFKQAESLLDDLNQEAGSYSSTVDKDHGRIERRTCVAVNLSDDFKINLAKKNKQKQQMCWKQLTSICKVTSERTIKGQAKTEVRYYISSIEADANRMLSLSRGHWEVENKLHWVLDVAFNEDQSRSRKGFSGENLAVLRQIALNLLNTEQSSKKSIAVKRKQCGWENSYLAKVLAAASQQE